MELSGQGWYPWEIAPFLTHHISKAGVTSVSTCLPSRSSHQLLPEWPGGWPFAAGLAGPAVGAVGRAVAGAAAGPAPPSHYAEAADWLGGCRWRGFHQDSRRAGLQTGSYLGQGKLLKPSLDTKNPSERCSQWNLKTRTPEPSPRWRLDCLRLIWLVEQNNSIISPKQFEILQIKPLPSGWFAEAKSTCAQRHQEEARGDLCVWFWTPHPPAR